MKRKWFASLLALTVLVTMSLGACSKGGSSPTEPSTPSETEGSGPALTGLDINKFEASKNPVLKSESISITATVVNPSATALTYSWSADGGSVIGPSNVGTWTAPNVYGEYEVKLVVNAANGESTQESIKMVVEPSVMASGTKNVPNFHRLDLEAGSTSPGTVAGSDVRFVAWIGPIYRIYVTNAALTGDLGAVDFNSVDYQAVKAAANSTASINLSTGQVIAIRTTEGRYGKIKIVSMGGTWVVDYHVWND